VSTDSKTSVYLSTSSPTSFSYVTKSPLLQKRRLYAMAMFTHVCVCHLKCMLLLATDVPYVSFRVKNFTLSPPTKFMLATGVYSWHP